MSFTSLSSTEVETGKPVTSTTANKIRTNFDDHENRIEALESGSSVDLPAITFSVNGPYSLFQSITVLPSVCKTAVNFSLNITGIRLYINTPGSSGTTSIDIKKKSGAGSWTSVLTTPPSVAYTAGADAVSTNAVIDPSQALVLAGDLLRLDIISCQPDAVGFFVRIDYTHA